MLVVLCVVIESRLVPGHYLALPILSRLYLNKTAAQKWTVLRLYSWLWSIEVTFHDTRQHLDIEEPQNRTRLAVQRTAPTALLLDSLIQWWHETTHHTPAPFLRPWRGKTHPSFAKILSALRLETLQNAVKTGSSTPSLPPPVKQLLEHLTHLFLLAT